MSPLLMKVKHWSPIIWREILVKITKKEHLLIYFMSVVSFHTPWNIIPLVFYTYVPHLENLEIEAYFLDFSEQMFYFRKNQRKPSS